MSILKKDVDKIRVMSSTKRKSFIRMCHLVGSDVLKTNKQNGETLGNLQSLDPLKSSKGRQTLRMKQLKKCLRSCPQTKRPRDNEEERGE